MTRSECKVVIKRIMDSYPNYNPSDLKGTVESWSEMLKDEPFEDVMYRLTNYISENKFAPAISDLMGKRKKDFSNFDGRNYSHSFFEELESGARY